MPEPNLRTGPQIEVAGIKGFARVARKASPALGKMLRTANKGLVEGIAGDAQGRVYPALRGKLGHGGGSSRRSRFGLSRTRSSIKAKASQQEASILLGGPRAPAALGHEFGSVRWPQFAAWRGSGSSAGYFLWPAIRAGLQGVEESYLDKLDEVVAEAFPD